MRINMNDIFLKKTFETLLYEQDNYVLTIYLNRPNSLNVFNDKLRDELTCALNIVAESDLRVLILGAKGKGFCSGADLQAGKGRYLTIEDQINQGYGPILKKLATMKQTVIGATQGAVAGIGSALAMSCDLLVMSEKSFMLQAFSNIGLIPDGGAHWHLLQNLGYKRTFELIAEGERLNASQCLELGLTNKVTTDEDLLPTAKAWANKLAKRAPLALANSKSILRRAANLSVEQTIAEEAQLQHINWESDDAAEGISAFIEKRTPTFVGK
jgi:2-(1,2-epoxy-1,2-dihydrophenyl)acetyl-CoA isomerase